VTIGREGTTYDVRIWGVSKRAWRSGTTYRVRWIVAQKEWHESFTTRALAESFRADLLSLARQGEPFDVACQRDGTTALPRPRDHLGVVVMVIVSPRWVNQDTPVEVVLVGRLGRWRRR
jgi:hypothetical protein